MSVETLKGLAEASQVIARTAVVFLVAALAFVCRMEISRKIARATEFSWGGAKLIFIQQLVLLKRSVTSEIQVTDQARHS